MHTCNSTPWESIEKQHLESILDSLNFGVISTDDTLKITAANKTALEITGYSLTDILGKSCCDVFRTPSCSSACPLAMLVESGNTIKPRELKIQGKSRIVSVSFSATLLKNSNSLTPKGSVVIFSDNSVVQDFKQKIHTAYSFQSIVSRNKTMKLLFDLLPDVAATEATVLLNGESGTGKELFARAIHDLSPRSNGPLITLNCGALPEQLLEAEIFGARKGAYTGAVENRPGRLQMAHQGTFFLDEIGDLPLPLQVKLLRVLEYREFQPLGASTPLKADVRFIAATHRNLEKMVANGLFRSDLYFRINVVQFKIPSLRERPDDIPLLIDTTLERFNKRYNKNIRCLSSDALQLLISYHYPGNVRELLNIIEQAVILCRTDEITANLIPQNIHASNSNRQEQESHANLQNSKIDRETLQNTLEQYSGNRALVSKALGIERTTLWRWMKKYGLDS